MKKLKNIKIPSKGTKKKKVKLKKGHMTDLNFFEPYLGEVRQLQTRNLTLFIVGIIVVFIITLTYSINLLKIRNVEASIEQKRSILSLGHNKEIQEEMQRNTMIIQALEDYYLKFQIADTIIETKNIYDTNFINKVNSTFPDEVYLISISYSEESVTMSCLADTRISVAELLNNLEETQLFSSVYTPGISGSADAKNTESQQQYNFSVVCKVKDVTSDEY